MASSVVVVPRCPTMVPSPKLVEAVEKLEGLRALPKRRRKYHRIWQPITKCLEQIKQHNPSPSLERAVLLIEENQRKRGDVHWQGLWGGLPNSLMALVKDELYV